jgi:hypothetical protein
VLSLTHKRCSMCGVEKEITLFYTNGGRRDGYSRLCKECQKLTNKKYRAKNYEKQLEWNRTSYRNNSEKVVERTNAYRRAHLDQAREYTKTHRKNNPEAVRAAERKQEILRPERFAAKTARRRSAKLNATPKWANHFFIGEAYDLAKRRTQATGFVWHVDHIVPLQSPIVCGLHVYNNLQVIPGVDNAKKSNVTWPDRP